MGQRSFRFYRFIVATLLVVIAAPIGVRADGCFTVPKFVWNKHKDINEPTQKAIIVYDNGHEDLLLQVKYEGPAEEFGWLVPVPTLPKVERGSMECFYELSKITQRYLQQSRHGTEYAAVKGGIGTDEEPPVKVIELKTVGAYEVAILSARDAGSLTQWLDAHQFAYPVEKSDVIEGYLKRKWYFIAARIRLGKGDKFEIVTGSPKSGETRQADTQQKLASGELHPLLISFETDKCVYPLKISSINGRPSEVQIITLSSQALMEARMFDKLLAALNRNNPNPKAKWEEATKKRQEAIANLKTIGAQSQLAPQPPSGDSTTDEKARRALEARRAMLNRTDLNELQGKFSQAPRVEPFLDEMESTNLLLNLVISATNLPACVKQFPQLKGKSWTLVKNTWTFSPEEMVDLEFSPAADALAARVNDVHTLFVLQNLQNLGNEGVPAIIQATRSTNAITRQCAASLLTMSGVYAEQRRHVPPSYDFNVEETGDTTPEPQVMPADARIVAAIKDLVDSPELDVRRSAVEAALNHWDKTLVPKFIELLSFSDEEVRRTASSALASHLKPQSPEFPAIVKLLGSTNAEAQASAVLILVRLDQPIPREHWASLLKNPHMEASSTIVTRYRDQELTNEELSALLQNPTPLARMMALKQATLKGDAASVDLAAKLLDDPVEVVRYRAGTTLQRLTGQEVDYKQPEKWRAWWEANKKDFKLRPMSR